MEEREEDKVLKMENRKEECSRKDFINGRAVGLAVVVFVLLLLLTFLTSLQLVQHSLFLAIQDRQLSNMWRGGIFFPAAGLMHLLPLGLSAGSASAALLYVSSYAGTITTLRLTLPNGGGDDATAAVGTLEPIFTSTECGTNPSWVALDYSKSFLFCTDEAWDQPIGTLSSFSTNPDGTLTPLAKAEVVGGPVSTAGYGVGGHGLAIASYSGSGVSVVGISPDGGLELVQNETYTLAKPGPNPSRQEAPHPHQAILDPTAAFVLVPDLGADLIRIYQANSDDLFLTPVPPLVAKVGSGPRHGAFQTLSDKTYFYLVAELANTLTGYEVIYKEDSTLEFNELFVISTHGEEVDLPEGTGAAEIALSPDEKFLIVSSRWENSMNITNFDPNNSTEIPSDPLIVFSIDSQTGSLTKIQEFPAGGRGPRHFSFNADGNLVAVSLQADGRVVVIERDVETGKLMDFVANATVEGEVNAAIFYEDNRL